MPLIPAAVLRKVYVRGSLRNTDDGFQLALKNVLAPAQVTGISALQMDGRDYPVQDITLVAQDGARREAVAVSSRTPYALPLNAVVTLEVAGQRLAEGSHDICMVIETQDVGQVEIKVRDTI